jgi:hypothetical protein
VEVRTNDRSIRSVWDPIGRMRPILSLRSCLRALLRRSALHKQPIIFDFTKGRAYRASDQRPDDLAKTMQDAAKKSTTGRVVRKTVEGIPPQVAQPKT